MTTVAGSKQYFAKSKVDGDVLALTVASEHQCRVTTTPVYHKYAHHERSVADSARGSALRPAYMALYGLALGGLGTYSYVSADVLAASESSESTPDQYRNGGITMIGLGGVLLAVAAIDQIRLQDSDEDLGEVSYDPEVREEACRRQPVANEKVIVRLRRARGDEWKAGDVADADGKLRVGLGELPESAFGSTQLELVALIEDAEVPIVLSNKTTSDLLESLASNSQSKIARDRDAQIAASCQQQFNDAQALSVTVETGTRELELIERRWKQAKVACGDKWQATHEEALAAFRETVAKTARERAERACSDVAARALEIFDQDPEGLDEDSTAEVMQSVRNACDGVASATTITAPVDGRVRKLEAARARAAKREATIRKMNERNSSHDAIGLSAMVTKDADAKAVLLASGQGPLIVRALAEYWIEKVGQGANNQSQLCATRGLVKLASGDLEWGKLRRVAVERAGAVRGTKISAAMEACK